MAVAVDHGDLAGARFDAQEQILDGFRLPAHEVIERGDARTVGCVRSKRSTSMPPVRIEEAIDRRREEALEIAVPQQDATFVLAHGELANEQHGPSPQNKKAPVELPTGAFSQALIGRLLKTPSDPLFERRQLSE